MCVQRVVMDDIIEDFNTGEYKVIQKDNEEEFEKAVKRRGCFLYYAWGVYCTSYALKNVISLSYCTIINDASDRDFNALYMDTDSCFSTTWNESSLEQYNKMCEEKLRLAGYEPVIINGRKYCPGVAELDKELSEFKTCGCKRYAYRDSKGLKITVAGVPKEKGGKCLNNNIDNFSPGFVFSGSETGKLTHIYQYENRIYKDEKGNYIADSINLVPCDYLLDESIESKIDSWGKEVIYLYNVYK